MTSYKKSFVKMALLTPVDGIQKFLEAKSIFLKHYENGNKILFSYHVPGSAKSRIYAGKSTKRGFSKKALTEIEIFFFVLGLNESLEGLEH